MSSETTALVQRCLDRLRAGDDSARADLLTVATGRLERLAHRMLRGSFPRVGRWADTGDILQSAMARLWAALAAVTPESPLHFHRLAALHLRRELLDLSRKLFGAHGLGGNHASTPPGGADEPAPHPVADAAASGDTPDEAAQWAELHERLAGLPADEAAVADLLYYQGLSQEAAAELLNVDVRTVQRRWQRVRRAFGAILAGE